MIAHLYCGICVDSYEMSVPHFSIGTMYAKLASGRTQETPDRHIVTTPGTRQLTPCLRDLAVPGHLKPTETHTLPDGNVHEGGEQAEKQRVVVHGNELEHLDTQFTHDPSLLGLHATHTQSSGPHRHSAKQLS